jgi:hypothetical protein
MYRGEGVVAHETFERQANASVEETRVALERAQRALSRHPSRTRYENARGVTAENELKYAWDDQTGHRFKVVREDGRSIFFAILSALYLIGALGFLIWFTADTWFQSDRVLGVLHLDPSGDFARTDSYNIVIAAGIAGAFGGALDSVRGLIVWHSERRAYGWRFFWKDVAWPWVGGVLAVLVYFTVRSGAGVVSGDFKLDGSGGVPVMSASALGALAGFNSRQVFRWLDARASSLFSTDSLAHQETHADGLPTGTDAPPSGPADAAPAAVALPEAAVAPPPSRGAQPPGAAEPSTPVQGPPTHPAKPSWHGIAQTAWDLVAITAILVLFWRTRPTSSSNRR